MVGSIKLIGTRSGSGSMRPAINNEIRYWNICGLAEFHYYPNAPWRETVAADRRISQWEMVRHSCVPLRTLRRWWSPQFRSPVYRLDFDRWCWPNHRSLFYRPKWAASNGRKSIRSLGNRSVRRVCVGCGRKYTRWVHECRQLWGAVLWNSFPGRSKRNSSALSLWWHFLYIGGEIARWGNRNFRVRRTLIKHKNHSSISLCKPKQRRDNYGV